MDPWSMPINISSWFRKNATSPLPIVFPRKITVPCHTPRSNATGATRQIRPVRERWDPAALPYTTHVLHKVEELLPQQTQKEATVEDAAGKILGWWFSLWLVLMNGDQWWFSGIWWWINDDYWWLWVDNNGLLGKYTLVNVIKQLRKDPPLCKREIHYILTGPS